MTHPTTCTRDDLRDDLVAWLDGALDDARRAEVEAHVAACASCQAERDALDLAWRRLDALPGLALRPGFLAEVEAAVLSSEPALKVVPGGASRGAGLRRWLAAAAAALLVAGAGLIATTGRPGASVGDQALRPDRPAPPAPVRTPTVTDARPAAPTTEAPTPPAPVTGDPLASLPAEERELVLNLELLRDLRDLEELGLYDAAELFDDLEAEELDEG